MTFAIAFLEARARLEELVHFQDSVGTIAPRIVVPPRVAITGRCASLPHVSHSLVRPCGNVFTEARKAAYSMRVRVLLISTVVPVDIDLTKDLHVATVLGIHQELPSASANVLVAVCPQVFSKKKPKSGLLVLLLKTQPIVGQFTRISTITRVRHLVVQHRVAAGIWNLLSL